LIVQHSASRKDFNGWVVAGFFLLFLLSVGVYRVASLSFPTVEAVAEAPS
jgi:hypothetical protein